MKSNTIVIIEDDKHTAALVALYLKQQGFDTVIAHDGEQGLASIRGHEPVLIVLDLMLPKIDGWDLCRRIRQDSDTPILMLTAREEETDRLTGFELGADDYVIKPFSPKELVARVKAILKRSHPDQSKHSKIMSHGPLTVDTEKRKVLLDGEPVPLTPHEYTLLKTLMSSPGKVFQREELLDRLYPHGETVVIDRVIDVHIGKLRQKIEKNLADPEYILTMRGVGYFFAEKTAEEA